LGSDRVFDVIGEVLVGKSLKDLIVDAIANRRTMEDILKDFERVPDEVAIKKVKEASLEALATRHIDLTRILGEQRTAKENRLVPEYIEEFFKRSAKVLNIKAETRHDGFWHVVSIPFEIRNQSYDFKTKYGEVQREYSKVSFDKEKAFEGQAEFVAMGHPLLESIVSAILARFDSVAEEGATFIDTEGKRDGILWFFQAEIKDGKNEIVGKRLFTVYQECKNTENSRQYTGEVGDKSLYSESCMLYSFVNPAILWDLKPLKSKDTENSRQNTEGGESHSLYPESCILYSDLDMNTIISFVISNGLENYKKELLERRLRDAEIKRKYGIRSLESMILDSDAKISDYETRRVKGENIPEATIQNEVRKKEDLERKKQRLLKEIDAEVHLYPTEPKIIGGVRIIPGKVRGEMIADDLSALMAQAEEIEQIGMDVTMEYERRKGRIPEDVHLENLGYDIRSKDLPASAGQAGEIKYRYIEVKARAREGAVALTPNEWLMAQRLKEEYWLYVVINAASNPELYVIENPALQLKPEEEISIVRYVVKNWKDKAEAVK
jgi:hypothetical protein